MTMNVSTIEPRPLRFTEWRPHLRDALAALENGQVCIIQLGNQGIPLFGYSRDTCLVAFAWGSADGPEGDLHLLVAPEYRHHDIATRLAIRYILRRNDTVSGYRLTLTEEGLQAFANDLGQYGFVLEQDRTFVRDRFSDVEMALIRLESDRLGALESEVILPAAT